jgi:hypothetical protein
MKEIDHYNRLSGGEPNLGLPEHAARLVVNVGSIIARGPVCVVTIAENELNFALLFKYTHYHVRVVFRACLKLNILLVYRFKLP